MSPEKQLIAIAEACGIIKQPNAWSGVIAATGEFCTIPDYLNDLNAMHEAEMLLTDEQRVAYTAATYDIACMAQKETGHWNWISLPAAQRREAFLKTIGKWEEDA